MSNGMIFCTLTVNESYRTQRRAGMQRKIQKLINNAAKCDKNQKLFVSLSTK